MDNEHIEAVAAEPAAAPAQSAETASPSTPVAPVPEAPEPKRRRVWLRILCILLVAFAVFEGVQYFRIEKAIAFAESCLDLPYVLGKAGDDAYDCSGLIRRAYGTVGKDIPHSAEEIGEEYPCLRIDSPSQLRRGDIICFDTVKDKDPSDHVGIWLGGNRFIHASSGKHKVMISELEGYYLEKFTYAKRPIPHL